MEGKRKIILAEKPIAGNKLHDALGIKAIPAVGHLIELKPKARKWTPPYFDLQWVVRKKEQLINFIPVLLHLSNSKPPQLRKKQFLF